MKWVCNLLRAVGINCRSRSADKPSGQIESVRIGSYNIKDGKLSSASSIAEVIKAQNLSAVALQEAGSQTVEEIASCLEGFTYVLGTHGKALLLYNKDVSGTEVYYLSGGRWPRSLDIVWVQIAGKKVALANVHLDVREEDRQIQLREVRGILDKYPNVIALGDFNATPDEEALRQTFTEAKRWVEIGPQDPTFPARAPEVLIDYIFVSSEMELETHNSWLPKSEASDHLPVCSEFTMVER